ncbi:outer spore coat protein CotE [Halalkalibacillus sediminis]|uniref:Outer spore coat protein CotE n=1 Tax=Halalkalibacillus sediminis TaxID=2018042 RepID=A0A2I0QWK8_9BACI|nr:outer spore coat protein CotE [Halalkalibacillus sediminis]PKR78694.1 outer spore coat protein CotE [Halalkalibacillus sediminis]
MLDREYREIITKAVCGKGKKFSETSHMVSPNHRPTSILGCWIINHQYEAKKRGKYVEVSGAYDINVWYSYSDNTKTEVVTERKQYVDKIPLAMRDEKCISSNFDVVARATQQPNTLECQIVDQGAKVKVELEREFVVDLIGETKVWAKVEPNGFDEDDVDLDGLESELADIEVDRD